MILATARWARSFFCVADEVIPELPAKEWLAEAGMPLEDYDDWLAQVRFRYPIG